MAANDPATTAKHRNIILCKTPSPSWPVQRIFRLKCNERRRQQRQMQSKTKQQNETRRAAHTKCKIKRSKQKKQHSCAIEITKGNLKKGTRALLFV